MDKTAVLVSGGVDSSVALSLLIEQGHVLRAFYLKIWLEDELSYLGNCPWEDDLQYVSQICEEQNIPLSIVPLQKEYFEKVVSYTINEVKQGRTPNPDILCNQQVKFGAFFDAIDASYTKVATGHYAQVGQRNGLAYLKMSPDPIKDQTYFLAMLNQTQLQRALFPIGHLHKQEVRELALQHNLPNAKRKDSQGICFLGKFAYNDFVRHYLGEKEGDLIEFETGEVVGTHKGYWFFTVGQRKGIGLSGGPWFVVKKDLEKNQVYVSRTYHESDKIRNACTVGSMNWIAGKPSEKTELSVKFRHGPDQYSAKVEPLKDNNYQITIEENDQGMAPGQFAVLYDGKICLGGGVIA